MQLADRKVLRWTAFPGILGGFLFLFFAINLTVPFFQPIHHRTLNVFIHLTMLSATFVWLTGTFLWGQNKSGIMGAIGYFAAVVGLILIGIWFYISDFLNMAGTVSLWTAWARIIFIWGIMMFGSATLQAGQFPHLAIILWILGFVLGHAGMAYQWSGRLYLIAAGMIWTAAIFWLKPRPTQKRADVPETEAGSVGRLVSLDLHRGLIMVIMAIDHASAMIRRSHPFEYWNFPMPDYFAAPGLFLTRFVTHICAPGFFFLMGTGMILFSESRRKLGWSHGEIVCHLTLRGALLIFLEMILWTPILHGKPVFTYLGVLFGLGGAMVVGAFMIRFNRMVLLGFGVAGVMITQLPPQFIMTMGQYNNPIMILFLVPQVSGGWVNYYPVLPWMSITALGMLFGKEILLHPDKAYGRLLMTGLICLALFPIIRWLGGFGNFRPAAGSGWINFLNVVKYPPSLVFTLITLGLNFVLLYLLEVIHGVLGNWQKPLLIFGKTALFFYFTHWYLLAAFSLPFFFIRSNLLWTYLGWATGLLMLYPICARYLEFKLSTAPGSIWRLI
ncbi:MAG: DUF1624 domain-containing protein [Desulfobacteraceae bacterium]|nr:DUF1624 domain-containing protein [Desulfobacteraceae bacterium]